LTGRGLGRRIRTLGFVRSYVFSLPGSRLSVAKPSRGDCPEVSGTARRGSAQQKIS